MILMLAVTLFYTVCSLSDKHAVAKLKMDGNTLTFLMASATSLFMLAYLPFDSRLFTMSWVSFAAIILMTLSKLFEFIMAAIVLREMSAFELKAWLGIILFASYAVDIISGTAAFGGGTAVKFVFIAVTTAGLFLIARSGSQKINYKKIALPLIGHLTAKFGYGLTVNLTKSYISPTLSLFFAFVLISLILAPKVKPVKLLKDREKLKGNLFVIFTKIPNVAGLVCENLTAERSMADYSMIQPMILISLFIIKLIRREECSKLNIIGGIVCIAGIVGFQLL